MSNNEMKSTTNNVVPLKVCPVLSDQEHCVQCLGPACQWWDAAKIPDQSNCVAVSTKEYVVACFRVLCDSFAELERIE